MTKVNTCEYLDKLKNETRQRTDIEKVLKINIINIILKQSTKQVPILPISVYFYSNFFSMLPSRLWPFLFHHFRRRAYALYIIFVWVKPFKRKPTTCQFTVHSLQCQWLLLVCGICSGYFPWSFHIGLLSPLSQLVSVSGPATGFSHSLQVSPPSDVTIIWISSDATLWSPVAAIWRLLWCQEVNCSSEPWPATRNKSPVWSQSIAAITKPLTAIWNNNTFTTYSTIYPWSVFTVHIVYPE